MVIKYINKDLLLVELSVVSHHVIVLFDQLEIVILLAIVFADWLLYILLLLDHPLSAIPLLLFCKSSVLYDEVVSTIPSVLLLIFAQSNVL